MAVHADTAHVQHLDGPATEQRVSRTDLPVLVAELEAHQPRWIWADTSTIAPELLQAGVRVRRCHDLRLCHNILRQATSELPWPDSAWDQAMTPQQQAPGALQDTLLEGFDTVSDVDLAEVCAEHERQRTALAATEQPAKLRLLLAAESAGALIAAEMRHDGLPWDTGVHDEILTAILGPRPHHGARPTNLEALAAQIREHLHAPRLSPDSPGEVLRALRAEGLNVQTTRKWELTQIDHPAIAPLLEYKQLARLLSSNGWAWMDAWVRPAVGPRRGRFHPDYVPGGVVTGRWATSGGGALQLPKQLRPAIRADPGWRLVVADAAQIEPRVLAAMSGDGALAAASRGVDLYQGLVEAGIVDTRAHAKVAMLGALYGATSGEAGLLMPRLMRAYPRATGVVEAAARAGERGQQVRTWLGRTCPPPSEQWHQTQTEAGMPQAGEAEERAARRQSRDWGRFTRNFVVQGTAAEWALCWLAEIRRRLWGLPDGEGRAHLVFFLHDEVIVHAPMAVAYDVAQVLTDAARAAGRLLFEGTEVEFPLDVAVVEDQSQAH